MPRDVAFDNYKNSIKELIVNNNVLILTSGTGLGKTTRVPLYMIELFTKTGLDGGYQIQGINNTGWRISNSDFIFDDDDYNLSNGRYSSAPYSYSLPYINENSQILCAQPKELLARENGDRYSQINKDICVSGCRQTPGLENGSQIINFKGKNGVGEWGTALTFVTSGWLTKYMISNPYLNNFSCVIVDEAHERSLDIDKLLGLLKKVLLVRPNFKIVIMSATIDEQLFVNYFYGAPYLHVCATPSEENNKQVDIYYLDEINSFIYGDNYEGDDDDDNDNGNDPFGTGADYDEGDEGDEGDDDEEGDDDDNYNPFYSGGQPFNDDEGDDEGYDEGDDEGDEPDEEDETNNLYDRLYKALETIEYIIKNDSEDKDILVFISSLNDMTLLLHDLAYVDGADDYEHLTFNASGLFLVANGRSDRVDRDYLKRENSGNRMKIIIATNVIESSITIDSLGYVIDCGLSKQANYDSKIGLSTLSILPIAKSSADQRKGRVGRVAYGECYRLYSEQFYEDCMTESTPPDIHKTNIENFFIELLERGTNFLNFDYIEPPSKEQTKYTMQKLKNYGIIPDDFSIMTDPNEMDDEYQKNLALYSSLSYCKNLNNLTIPNELIDILLTFINKNGHANYYILNLILLAALSLTDFKIKINNPRLNGENDIINIYNSSIEYYSKDDNFSEEIDNLIQKLENASIEFYDDEDEDEELAVASINEVLTKHGNVCSSAGVVSYNCGEDDCDGNVYFQIWKGHNNAPGGDDEDVPGGDDVRYTYVTSEIKDDKFQYKLLTRIYE